MKQLFVLGILLYVPTICSAEVTISEIAWMGSGESANHEWIELHSDGEAIDVTGWTLVDDNNLTIELEGTISAGAYAVAERTSDVSAPGAAFVLYTGALSNAGATLTLQDDNGSVVDRVVGGDGWQNVGGDNTTKETAQRSAGAWITALATPGAAASGQVQVVAESEETTTINNTQTQTRSTTRVIKADPQEDPPLGSVKNELTLTIAAPEIAYVQQRIPFAVTASGLGKTLTNSLRYEWSFGDGMAARGIESIHRFLYPGTYVVTAYASFASVEHMARHEIAILPVELSLDYTERGDIQITNESHVEISVAGFTLRAATEFVFPKRTIILPGQSIIIPRSAVGEAHNVVLSDTSNTVVVSHAVSEPAIATAHTVMHQPQVTAVAPIQNLQINKKPREGFGFSAQTGTHAPLPTQSDTRIAMAIDEQPAALPFSDQENKKNPWPFIGLITLLGFGILGLLIKPAPN